MPGIGDEETELTDLVVRLLSRSPSGVAVSRERDAPRQSGGCAAVQVASTNRRDARHTELLLQRGLCEREIKSILAAADRVRERNPVTLLDTAKLWLAFGRPPAFAAVLPAMIERIKPDPLHATIKRLYVYHLRTGETDFEKALMAVRTIEW